MPITVTIAAYRHTHQPKVRIVIIADIAKIRSQEVLRVHSKRAFIMVNGQGSDLIELALSQDG